MKKYKQNEKAEYAILITELEPTHEFGIKVAKDDRNIFIIRPPYLIFLLTTLKYLKIMEQDISLVDKEKVISEIEELKNSFLSGSFTYIESQINKIIKNNKFILEKAKEIQSAATLILEKHLKVFRDRLEKINASKKINKIFPTSSS